MNTYLDLLNVLKQWLVNHGIRPVYADWVKIIVVLVGIALIAFIAFIIIRRILLSITGNLAKKPKYIFIDILLKKKVFQRFSHLTIPVVVYYLITLPLGELPNGIDLLQRITGTYITIVCLTGLLAFINAVEAYFQTLPAAKSHSIKGYLQVIKIVLYSVSLLTMFSILLRIDAVKILSLLGASVALLIFVFRDTILGFVASVQLSVNDLLRPGDWIEVPGQKADGIVRDITLTTVKIQNWDNTYTTVPTYSLLSNSFTNWRGMQESEGRRVKKAVNIDMKSVRFYSEDLIETLSGNNLLNKVFDVKKFISVTQNAGDNKSITNLGILRAYLESYIKAIPAIHPDMTLLIHYLQPVEYGLPLELIFFTREKDLYHFEKLQCELMDHLFAIIGEFDLKIFQV